jgi:hypothetical protein
VAFEAVYGWGWLAELRRIRQFERGAAGIEDRHLATGGAVGAVADPRKSTPNRSHLPGLRCSQRLPPRDREA